MINIVAFPFRIDNHSTEDMTGAHGEVIKPKTFTQYSGMTLRDYFAAEAMGVIAAGRNPCASGGSAGSSYFSPSMLAKQSYDLADAMIAAREGANHG